MNSPHWHILGAGSIGSIWASRMMAAGYRVTLVLKNGQAVGFNGLVIEDGKETDFHPEVTEPCLLNQPVNRLLVTTKAQDTSKAIQSIANYISSDCMIVSMQNGMGLYEEIQSLLPDARVFSATTTDGVNRTGPFRFRLAGLGETWFGSLDTNADIGSLTELVRDFDRHDVKASLEPDMKARLWQKLAINSVINPLTVIHNCPNGEIFQYLEPGFLDILGNEIDLVMAAESVSTSIATVELATEVANKTAANISSMLQDIRAGRATEIDYITGYLIQTAEKHGIRTPANRALLEQVKGIQAR